MIETVSADAVFDTVMDSALYEYFKPRDIVLDTMYRDIPNNVWKGAFRYVWRSCFKPADGTTLAHNANSFLITDYNAFKTVSNWYIDIVYKYNIVSFIECYVSVMGIDSDTFIDWTNNNYKIDKLYKLNTQFIYDSSVDLYHLYKMNDSEYWRRLCSLRADAVQKIRGLGAETVRGRLSDDRTGVVVLANNDREIALEYEQKRVADRIETTARTVAELPNLFATGGLLQGFTRK